MRRVHGSHHADQKPMRFNSEQEILDYLKRHQMSPE